MRSAWSSGSSRRGPPAPSRRACRFAPPTSRPPGLGSACSPGARSAPTKTSSPSTRGRHRPACGRSSASGRPRDQDNSKKWACSWSGAFLVGCARERGNGVSGERSNSDGSRAMGTIGQGQQDATRGGIAAMSRRAANSAAVARPRPEAVPMPAADPAERRPRQRRPQTPPQPRNARPAPSADPADRRTLRRRQEPAPQPRNARFAPQAAPSQAAPSQVAPPQPASAQAVPRAVRAAAGSHRAPFVLLLCGLLGGALVSALVISTTLAEGSFQITGLQQSTNALARQRQALEQEVAQAQSAQVLQSRAIKLGMRPVSYTHL